MITKKIQCQNCKKKFTFKEPKDYQYTDLMPDGVLQGGFFYCQDCCDELEDDGGK
jgi:hypothetical protein